MGMTNLFALGRSVAGDIARRFRPAQTDLVPQRAITDASLFAASKAKPEPGAPATGRPSPFGLATAVTGFVKPKRSWFGWLWGGNRRRDPVRLVQGELLLQNVRPVRNDLVNDDVALVERRQSKVLYQTPEIASARDDQGHAWNRLRGRKLENLVVKTD
jgi:hypothetical protein